MDHNPFGTQKIVSLDDRKRVQAHWGSSGKPITFKNKHCILLYRRNMAERLLKRRKTKINQMADNLKYDYGSLDLI
jgi:hypothetical protein